MRWADPSSGGVLPSVVCLSVISKPQQWGGLDPRKLSSHNKIILTKHVALSPYVAAGTVLVITACKHYNENYTLKLRQNMKLLLHKAITRRILCKIWCTDVSMNIIFHTGVLAFNKWELVGLLTQYVIRFNWIVPFSIILILPIYHQNWCEVTFSNCTCRLRQV
jgi:hypothetical protein